MNTSAALESLAAQALVWRGDALAAPLLPGLATGFAELDAAIPGGGWPVAGLTELFSQHEGIGELSLFLPVIARLTQEARWVCLVTPPRLPYAPAFAAAGVELSHLLLVQAANQAETLWSLRQAVASGACALVLGWLGSTPAQALRRLQLAAEAAACALVLCRPLHLAREVSPAVLKLHVDGQHGLFSAKLLKRRGGHLAASLPLNVTRPVVPHAVACTLSAQSAAAGFPAWHA